MTDEPARDERGDDLTDGWPDEPANAELQALGRRLREERPSLSPEALARVERRMRREMAPARVRVVRWFVRLAAAAVFLVAVGLARHWLHRQVGDGAPRTDGPKARARVRDTYELPLAAPRVRPPAGPLVKLADYESLYEEVRLAKGD